ncbi:hypothetical protein [Pseudobacteriovorax antillogorgiicola]|uniref:C2H2-type domain-containing protein n=1 Tax=Pseudobacteriovorax antillogorgiicola TaxID=1513793 RepID=A0A1Y6BTW2_9BACT|nr:hypothetical protein [Pseudobacteriovorax antillogorgiicola]TCS52434.1 hypothetical protein EDD56_109179 [Pseudobacteriovorax antillogorgiicola]SMF28712.1 hypothetical protein SAMN06296036_10934 [Pseudobacteriovorax antillogorgiicola]
MRHKLTRFISTFAILYLIGNVFICSLPRCGFIFSAANTISQHIASFAHESSCHHVEPSDEHKTPGPMISNKRFCECELLNFVMTVPKDSIRSIDQKQVTKPLVYQSSYARTIPTVHLELDTPPPRFA